MYRLFIANKNYSSWSLRPWVLMRERGIPFEEEQVQFASTDNWAAFRAFAPNGQVPCLREGETVVWDSLGIVEYLAERHEGIWPVDEAARSWARCAAAEMHSGFSTLRERGGMNCGVRVKLRETPPLLRRDIGRIEELWQQGLERFGGPFLAGPAFTAVDAFFAPMAFRTQTYGFQLGGAASAYVQRLLDLPAMKDWYEDALDEPFREEAHERGLLDYGTITQDFRLTMMTE